MKIIESAHLVAISQKLASCWYIIIEPKESWLVTYDRDLCSEVLSTTEIRL